MITHPEKVMFPEDGITKGELAAYYEAVAPVMLPHIEARPITIGRRGAGSDAKGTAVEVLEGVAAGERYVARNSFILKAELGKSEAGHEH